MTKTKLSDMSLGELDAVFAKAAMTGQERAMFATESTLTEQWVQRHPEFLRCRENARQMEYYFRSRGQNATSIRAIEDAYLDNLAAGVIKLDHTKLSAEKAEKLDQAIAARRAENPETMPLEHLRQRCSGVSPHRVSENFGR